MLLIKSDDRQILPLTIQLSQVDEGGICVRGILFKGFLVNQELADLVGLYPFKVGAGGELAFLLLDHFLSLHLGVSFRSDCIGKSGRVLSWAG